MRNLLIYIFVSLYFVVSIGLTANVHLCNEKFQSISFNSSNVKSCCGNKKMKKGCCKNLNIVLKKISSEKINSITTAQIQPVAILTEQNFHFQEINLKYNESANLTLSTHPPNLANYPKLIIVNCNFRI